MKALVFVGVAATTLMLGGLAPAEASGGCGPFAHRGFYGACRPNGGFGYGYGYRRPFYGYGYRRPFYGYGGGWHHHYY